MTADAVVAALRARLAAHPRDSWEVADLKPAAVLVPLVRRGGELRLVFTLRSASLPSHSGQISFPGGKCDQADLDRAATAIREADEELGIEPACVEVLGLLGNVPTPTGYMITPVVALLDPAPAAYRPSEAEVAEVFEVALARFRDPALFEDRGRVERWGRTYQICAYRPDGRDIWGATARMVKELLGVLDAVC